MKRATGGFSLCELLAAAVAVALVAAAVLAAAGPVANVVQRAQCAVTLRGLGNAYMAYVANDLGRFPPLVSPDEHTPDGQYAAWLPGQLNYLVVYKGSFEQGFGPLVWHRLIRDPDDLVCPAVREGWWHAAAQPEGKLWHTKASNVAPGKVLEDWLRGNRDAKVTTRAAYSIRPRMYRWTPDKLEREGVRAILADNLSVPRHVLGRHGQGVNVLYIDGSVDYRDDEILWNNELDGAYHNRSNQALVMRLWEALDKPRPAKDAKDDASKG